MGKKQEQTDEEKLAEEIVKKYDAKTGKDLNQIMRDFMGPVIQKMLEAEMESKIGYQKNERAETDNYRNGYHTERTINTDYGEMDVRVPRDRNGEIESDLLPKYSRNINGFEEKVVAMYGLGMSNKQISEQIDELFGCKLSADMISDITDKIIPEIQDWQKRKLDKMYPVVFIDAIHFSVKDNGQVVKKAAYIVLGMDSDGFKHVLSIVVGENESAKMWLSILNDLKNRGVQDILILCSDALTGIKDAIATVYPDTDYQRCIVHQIRNSLKYVRYENKKELAKDLKRVYTSSTAEQGFEVLVELEEKWSKKYPSAIRSWQDNWDSLSTFFKYSQELRTVMYTTNAIESLNSSYRRANRNRVVFPTNMSLLKTLYLATLNIEKKWTVRHKDWDVILSQLSIYYPDRI
jgi:transposase-like protein